MTGITKSDLVSLKHEIIEEFKSLLQSQCQPHQEFLKSSQVKALLGCSDSKLESLRKNGGLSYTKIGGTIYYNSNDLSKQYPQIFDL